MGTFLIFFTIIYVNILYFRMMIDMDGKDISSLQPAGLNLRVEGIYTPDIGRGITYVDVESMRKLKIAPGDVIAISGTKTTPARCYPDRKGKGNFIRLDPITRLNAGLGREMVVKVAKAGFKEAQKIVLAPDSDTFLEGGPNMAKRLLNGRVFKKEDMVEVYIGKGIGKNSVRWHVLSTLPSAGFLKFTTETELKIRKKPDEMAAEKAQGISYDDIGGLDDILRQIREMVELPFTCPEVFEKAGIEPPRGLLLHGPPGAGKTLIAKAIANQTGAYYTSIRGPEIISKWAGESESNLRKIFSEASENSPSIIFIDEIDSIAARRDSDDAKELGKRLVGQLLTLMDGLQSRDKVIVIAATNRPNSLDPALRRPGRFDREIEIQVPNQAGRREILDIYLKNMPLAEDVDPVELAKLSPGYTGADIYTLCKEAAIEAINKYLPKDPKQALDPTAFQDLQVSNEDFMNALKKITPSELREIPSDVSRIQWDEIIGMEDIKERLKEIVCWPLIHPKLFQYMKAKPPRGILLYGPAGSGKTLLGKALSEASNSNLIYMSSSEIINRWQGESESTIRKIFQKAKRTAPCIVFLDELDVITSVHGGITDDLNRRIITQLNAEFDKLSDYNNVVVVGATRSIDLMDPALISPGRLERLVEVTLPDIGTRKSIIEDQLKGRPLAGDISYDKVAKMCPDFSVSQLKALCEDASLVGIKKYLKNVKEVDPGSEKFPTQGPLIDMESLKTAIKGIIHHKEALKKKFKGKEKTIERSSAMYM